MISVHKTHSDILVTEGELFSDYRGDIRSINALSCSEFERFYLITHNNVKIIRGWHGHQFEKKWFYCVKGEFFLAVVQPDNWHNPSYELPTSIFKLSNAENYIVHLPGGYANCLKATIPDSTMIVFSDKSLAQAKKDSWRYDNSLWVNWSEY